MDAERLCCNFARRIKIGANHILNYILIIYSSDIQDVSRSGGKGGGTVVDEKGFVAESPQDADAGHATVLCRVDVDVAVTDVNCSGDGLMELAERLHHSVGSWFLLDVLALADGHRDIVGEEVVNQLLRGSVELVADHSHSLTIGLQGGEHLHDSGIGSRVVEIVVKVVLTEDGVNLFEARIGESVGYSTLHELLHSVAYKHSHLLKCTGRHVTALERIVAAFL